MVARSVRDAEAAGSSPAFPTRIHAGQGVFGVRVVGLAEPADHKQTTVVTGSSGVSTALRGCCGDALGSPVDRRPRLWTQDSRPSHVTPRPACLRRPVDNAAESSAWSFDRCSRPPEAPARSRPTRARDSRLPRAEVKEPIFLTPEQVEVLPRAARPPYGVLIRFAAATGLRPSEICGLRVRRLDLRAGTVEVAEARTVVGGRTEDGPPKSGSRRTVQLPSSVCAQVREHLEQRAADAGRPLTGDDYVFTVPEGGPLRRDLLHKRIFKPAVIDAGLPDSLRMHDLRHTCTSILIALGAHPKVIQEWLGHRSITVTMDVYAHLFPSLNQDLADQMDGVFRRAAGDHEAETATEPKDRVSIDPGRLRTGELPDVGARSRGWTSD